MFQILVVEDDRDLNRSVCSFLNQSGYKATGCLGAEEAYDAMYTTVFDLIVSDIMMPNTDGFALAEAVRAIRTINLADGAVSILALQTALLFTFRSGDVDVSLFNTFTGAAVSLLTLALGVFMIVEAQKKIKQIQRENIQ